MSIMTLVNSRPTERPRTNFLKSASEGKPNRSLCFLWLLPEQQVHGGGEMAEPSTFMP